jgi:hypothetical protein
MKFLLDTNCPANALTLVTHRLGELRRVPELRIEDWESTP